MQNCGYYVFYVAIAEMKKAKRPFPLLSLVVQTDIDRSSGVIAFMGRRKEMHIGT